MASVSRCSTRSRRLAPRAVSYDEAPLVPGASADFLVVAPAGARLSFVGMWIQSNDTFYGTVAEGIPLAVGEVTGSVRLWDAGTEVNQEPGLGPDQAPRQTAPNTGPSEGGTVAEIDGTDRAGFSYPSVASSLRVSITLDAPP